MTAAYEAAGSVGGSWAGRVLGGLIGSVFGPPGIVVGQFLGSQAGAIAGRAAGLAVAQMMEGEDGKIEDKTSDQPQEDTCTDCTEAEQKAKDAKRMSKSELDKAAKNNGFEGAHGLKDEYGLGSDVDVFVDRDGELYQGPRKGTGVPQPLGINKSGRYYGM